ncbi:ABC transporter permease [Geodermatophilus sp. URMC 64]
MERGDVGLSTVQGAPVRDGDAGTVAVADRPSTRRRHRWVRVLPVLGALPFFLYVAVFLLLPVGVLAVEAFRATDPVTFQETWSTASIGTITEGAYRRAYLGSLRLSAITAVLGAALGLALAVAVLRTRRGTLLRRLVLTASGVAANFGGVPLAFAFLATIGNAGVLTALLQDTLGLGLGGFSLYSMAGLALVYLYFLIPLMVLTITPALEALRPQWREAADNLGASGWQYWRYVGGPVLAPPVIGATMLLFATAFAAYATARALVGSSVPLVTLQIADALSSNVVVGSENLGKALALGMVVLIGIVMAFYAWVQRRTQRWLS